MMSVATNFKFARNRLERKNRRFGSRRGLTLLETLLAVGVAALIAAGAAYAINERTADFKAKAAADQLTLVAQAAETYIKNKVNTVSDMVPTAGSKAIIPLADLVAANYLPAGPFLDTPYAADYEIWVRGTGVDSNGLNGFQAMVVVVGGEDPGRARLPQIALQTKANTGFVVHAPYDNANDDKILGTFGGWTANVSAFRPSGGSGALVWLASLLAVQDDITGNDFLYRGKIPGRPDLNAMRTDITMTLDSGIIWKDPDTGKQMDIRLAKTGNTNLKTTMIIDGDTPTTEVLFQSPNTTTPVSIQVLDDTTLNPAPSAAAPTDGQLNLINNGGSVISINSTIDKNTLAAANAKTPYSTPYNLYVDGKTNITGNLDIGGNTNIKRDLTVDGKTTANGDVILGDAITDKTEVKGIFNVAGDATFQRNVTIEGNLDLKKCLSIGGAPDAATSNACLNVGNLAGSKAFAARFHDTVDINTGNAGIKALTANADIETATNMRAQAYFYNSDARYKSNIEPLENSLQKLLQVQGVTYNWKNNGRHDMGVIAQDVEEVFPELVHTDADGMKAVEYGNFIAPIIEGMRQLKDENDQLKAKVETLTKDGKK